MSEYRPEFVIWTSRYVEGWCTLLRPEPYEDLYELDYGQPLADRWPADSFSRMDPDRRKDLQLADSVRCPYARTVSTRLRTAIETAGETRLEWLPLAILNHKGRVAARDYWIANPPYVIDCIDLDASNARWAGRMLDADDPFAACDRLVLRPEVVPPGVQVFRARFKPGLLLMRRTMAEALLNEGLSGLAFGEPDAYRGLAA